MNAPNPGYPTLAELKVILIRDFKCWIDPPPKNLAYSPKPLTIFKRKTDEHIDREIALYICRRLHIYPAKLTFISNPPTP